MKFKEQNGEKGAFSSVDLEYQHFQKGLTKREYFAGLAMQGLLSLYDNGMNSIVPNVPNVEYMAKLAVTASDELLKQLES